MKIKLTLSSLLLLILLALVLTGAFHFDYLKGQAGTFLNAPETASTVPPAAAQAPIKPAAEASKTSPLTRNAPAGTHHAGRPAGIPNILEAPEDDQQTLQEALNDFYSSTDEDERESALMTLGEIADPKAREALLYALNDPNNLIREQAVSQISNWENDKERQEMTLTALGNDNPEIVVMMLESMTEIENPELQQKIKDLAQSSNADVSEAAKTILELEDAS